MNDHNVPQFAVVSKQRPKGAVLVCAQKDTYEEAMKLRDELAWELNNDRITTSLAVVEL